MRILPRELKFRLINALLVPPALLILRLWVRTFRTDPSAFQDIANYLARPDLYFIVALHGEPFGLITGLRFCRDVGRPVCVLTSPSRDGQLMDKIVRTFGGETVLGSSSSKAVEGSLGLVEAVKQGKLGLLAVDGPRGPLAVPKPGFYRLAKAAGARLLCITVGCDHALQFGAWDGLYIPAPFSRLRFKLSIFEILPDETQEAATGRLQRHLIECLREVRSPVLRKMKTGA